jgi:hypothetical protein
MRGAGGTSNSIAIAERPKVKATKASDDAGADMLLAQVRGCEG